MKQQLMRGAAVLALAGAAFAGAAGTAIAEPNDEPEVVDEPNTDDLNDKYTFAPLGIPVLGLIDSLNGVPGKILPGA